MTTHSLIKQNAGKMLQLASPIRSTPKDTGIQQLFQVHLAWVIGHGGGQALTQQKTAPAYGKSDPGKIFDDLESQENPYVHLDWPAFLSETSVFTHWLVSVMCDFLHALHYATGHAICVLWPCVQR